MNEYLESVKKRDPAAKSILSIILTYPGVKAVFIHKISNFFHAKTIKYQKSLNLHHNLEFY